ncbi:preprotein translocase subunit SecG [Puniceibacterium sediminis]|uniref:Protein-export membrane protein SecG n=1 Tax=Puniceibacterium sediminis TaxID=1608407 RepID=A0A238UUX4_9RHOB|nr:preprotein translocase subunit SecG [Puniceibacterium sediminis]SNR26025.1 protein translocase subunit secG [Puniceibacterium sediminis]
MENVILIIHLLLALALIGVVLMQRSEGGGLGMGGGGGGGAMSGRAAATALGKITWFLAAAFICTSITLTVIAAANSSGSSIMDRLTGSAPEPAADITMPDLNTDGLLPPPTASEGDATSPLVPRATE